MSKLRRMDKIRLFNIGGNKFEARNKQDDVVLNSDDNYFIYMQSVNFKNGNIIEGRYLGELDNSSPLIDKYCKTVSMDGNKFYSNGKEVRTAKMVAVNNNINIIIIIDNGR